MANNAFGYMLTKFHVPSLAANLITGVSSNPYVIAILLNVILLVLGMIMDMAPIILITTPILLPIATSIGIDPVHAGRHPLGGNGHRLIRGHEHDVRIAQQRLHGRRRQIGGKPG